jgi:hypothetical protein
MPIVAIFATIWANRKSHIMFVLHGIKKVLADLQHKIHTKTMSPYFKAEINISLLNQKLY